MNQYGQQAWDHYRKFLPDRLKAIGTPAQQEQFFTALGDEALDRIEDLTGMLSGTPGPDYLQNLGTATVARRQAEEIVNRELVLPAPPDPDDYQPVPENQDPPDDGEWLQLPATAADQAEPPTK